MSNTFLDHPRRFRRLLGLLIVGVVAGCLTVAFRLAVDVARSPHEPENTTLPVPAAAPWDETGIDEDGTPAPVAGLGPLQTVQGTRTVNGVSVGYPHTAIGAVSAAVYYWSQLSSTLDVDRATTVIKTVADPAWKGGTAEIRNGRTVTRKELGVSVTGPVPAGASVLLTPVMYQVRHVQNDAMDVLLLAYYESSAPGAEPVTKVILMPTKIRWTGGDWKLPEQTLDGDYSELFARPGTADATGKGWQSLTS